ncbi:MAG: YfhO family protein [Oscillospiraceae bacterium]|nr:YfhO family protein [Oscillospiraceae bacterium]
MKTDRKYIFYAFAVNFALALMLIAVAVFLGDGVFYMGIDYNYQQIPFNELARENLLQGNYMWLDNFELGTSFIGALSFYTVGSPFFWLTMAIPNADYTIVIPLMLALKFAVAGTGAYCYAKQYLSDKNWALVAGMFYAFCGYQISNINYNHFHDVTALFPFLLLALDSNVKQDKGGWFAVMVALMALTNYFFFVAVVVFLIIYFIVKVVCREYRITTKLFLRLAAESLLGVGMAMVLLLPSVIFVLGNSRVSQSILELPLARMLLHKPYQYADLLRALLIPAENLFDRSIILSSNHTAAELYLPVVGCIPVFSYMFNHKKDWMSKLSLVCFVFMFVPVLNSSFTAFNEEYYTRWFFMPALIFATMAAKHFENRDSIKPGLIGWGVTAALFYTARWIWHFYFQSEFFPNRLIAFIMIGIAFAGVATTVILHLVRNKKYAVVLLTAAIFAQMTSGFAIYTYYTHRAWSEENEDAAKFFHQVQDIKYPDGDEYYRTETTEIFINTGLVSDKPSANIFATNISTSVFDFYRANNMKRTVNSFLSKEQYGYYGLLGVKYMMLPQGEEPDEDTKGFSATPVWNDTGYDFYLNTNFAGMGFAYENAISERDYALLSKGRKHLASMDAVVLSDELLQRYGQMFNIKTKGDYSAYRYEDFVQSVQDRKTTAAQNFAVDKGVYSFDVCLDKETVYYVAVPYDAGFTATANGKDVPVVKVNNGLVGLVLSSGESSVLLSYYPQGLKAGIFISIASAVLFACWLIFDRRRKNV